MKNAVMKVKISLTISSCVVSMELKLRLKMKMKPSSVATRMRSGVKTWTTNVNLLAMNIAALQATTGAQLRDVLNSHAVNHLSYIVPLKTTSAWYTVVPLESTGVKEINLVSP